jgi:Mu-like prophage FluMu N-terminal domain
MAKNDKAKPAGAATKGLKVIAKRDGFRRAGHVFSGEAKVLPLSELTEEQADAIRAESMLVCTEVEIEPT